MYLYKKHNVIKLQRYPADNCSSGNQQIILVLKLFLLGRDFCLQQKTEEIILILGQKFQKSDKTFVFVNT